MGIIIKIKTRHVLLLAYICISSGDAYCQTPLHTKSPPPLNYHIITYNIFQGDSNAIVIEKDGKYIEIQYYKTGQINSETEMKISLGADTFYYPSTLPHDSTLVINVIAHFNGQAYGKYSERYLDGNIKISGSYIKGEKEGIWIYYNEQGIVIKKEEWSKNILKNPKDMHHYEK